MMTEKTCRPAGDWLTRSEKTRKGRVGPVVASWAVAVDHGERVARQLSGLRASGAGRIGAGVVIAVIMSAVAVLMPGHPADAAKVDNPGGGYTLRVQTGFLRIRNNSFDFNDEGRQPQCSDGSNNDGGQDSAVDFPADPQCTSATDDSETQGGFQAKQPIQMTNGTITAAGAVTFAAANVSFPTQYVFVDAPSPLSDFVAVIRVIPTHDVTGTINPISGALSLRIRVRVSITGGPLDSSCTVGTAANPIDINTLTTGTTSPPGPNTPISGTPYNPATGRAKIVNNSFAVPGAQNCGSILFQSLDDAINDEFGLPSPSGNNEAQFTVEFIGTRPQPAVVASFTTTPSSGPAPLNVNFNGSSSSGSGLTYQWDFTNNGSFDATGVTTSFSYSFPGTFTARLRVTDSDGDFAETTRLISVGANAPPTANDQSVAVVEDTPKAITLTGSDPEGQPLTFSISSPPAHGTLTGTAPTVTYDPAGDYNGPDSFQFRVTDNFGQSDTGTVTITVAPENDAPVAADVAASTTEDTPVTVTLVATDIDGDSLTYGVVDQPTTGSVNCSSGGSCTYTPDQHANGVDTFTYRASDSDGELSNVATATVTIAPVNDAPVANDLGLTVAEDGNLPVTLSGSDVDGDPLTFQVLTLPTHGSITGAQPTLTYTPSTNYNGPDSFMFRVSDPAGSADTGTVSITVTPVNDAPVAADSSVTTAEDTPAVVNIVANDIDGDELTFVPSSPTGEGGTVTCAGNACTYTPAAGYAGLDAFTVLVDDGNGGTATATVEVTVTAFENTPPDASDSTVVVIEGTTRTFSLPGTDADGDSLTFTVLIAPIQGSLECSPSGSCTYTPHQDATAPQTFVYRVSDGRGGIDEATVALGIVGTNDAPVVVPANLTTAEDTAGTVDLIAGDPDGDTLSWAVKRAPLHGALTCTADGSCTYTPIPNFNGADSFEVEVDDGHGARVRMTVSVTVTPVDDAPTAGTVRVSLDEDGSAVFALVGNDRDGDTLSFTAASSSLGALTCTDEGACSFDAAADANGTDTVIYTVRDGTNATTGAIVIVIVPTNDAPVAEDMDLSTAEDAPLEFVLAATDVDPGDILTFWVTSAPRGGTLSGSAPNLTYTPAPQASGVVTFGYAVVDSAGATDAGTVTITVFAVDDTPMATPVSAVTPEDTPIDLTLGGTDEEGPVTVAIDSGPSHGSYDAGVYTPSPDYHGPDEITFTVTDEGGQTDAATAQIVVTPVNDAPVAAGASVNTTRTVPVDITLSGTDVDGDSVTFSVLTGPAHGSLSGSPPNLTYTPAGVYRGPDAFTFAVTDSSGASDSATVVISVDHGGPLPTTLEADPATVTKPSGLLAFLMPYTYNNLSAVLHTSSGIPLAGQRIVFSVNGTTVCSATTNADGRATCSGKGPRANATTYQASYGGNPDYEPATANGALS